MSRDTALIAALQDGLPLVPRPYEAIANELGRTEAEIIADIGRLIETGVISRFGVVIRHHEAGYRANAMTVFDVPDDDVRGAARRLVSLPYITLCYRRTRRLPTWPYNLFCMIHGRDRAEVERQIEEATAQAGLTGRPRAVLFSRRRFKQRGARYAKANPRVREAA